jgi:hypothetical protein
MNNQSRLQALSFESALQAYEMKTGIMLAQHPLAADIQNHQSVDDITTLLQGRAQVFSDFRARDRMMKAIKTTVSLLIPLSDPACLTASDATDLVRRKALMAYSISLTFFRHHSHLRRQYKLASVYYWMYVPFSSPSVDIVVTLK